MKARFDSIREHQRQQGQVGARDREGSIGGRPAARLPGSASERSFSRKRLLIDDFMMAAAGRGGKAHG